MKTRRKIVNAVLLTGALAMAAYFIGEVAVRHFVPRAEAALLRLVRPPPPLPPSEFADIRLDV